MKLIEFLLEIAKGNKDLPKRIIYNYKVFELEDFLHYKHKGNQDLFDEIKYYTNVNVALNDNVEIIEEEKKIPEKLGYFDLTKDKNEKDENGDDLELHYTGVSDTFDDVYKKINEIIEVLNEMREDK